MPVIKAGNISKGSPETLEELDCKTPMIKRSASLDTISKERTQIALDLIGEQGELLRRAFGVAGMAGTQEPTDDAVADALRALINLRAAA